MEQHFNDASITLNRLHAYYFFSLYIFYATFQSLFKTLNGEQVVNFEINFISGILATFVIMLIVIPMTKSKLELTTKSIL